MYLDHPEKNRPLDTDIRTMSCDEFYDYVERLVVEYPVGFDYAFRTIDAFDEFLKSNKIDNLPINLKGFLTDILLGLNVQALYHTVNPELERYIEQGNRLIEIIDAQSN